MTVVIMTLTCMVHITGSWVSGVPGLIVPGRRSDEGQSQASENNIHKLSYYPCDDPPLPTPNSKPNLNLNNQEETFQSKPHLDKKKKKVYKKKRKKLFFWGSTS